MGRRELDPAEKLQTAMRECRVLLQEVHGATKDLTRLHKQVQNTLAEGRAFVASVGRPEMEAALTEQVGRVMPILQQFMEQLAAKYIAEFDRMSKILMGRQRRDGRESLDELFAQYVRKEGLLPQDKPDPGVYVTEPLPCPHCGAGNSGHTGNGEPDAGHVSVCTYCGQCSVFERLAGRLFLRSPTEAEVRDMSGDDEVQALRAAFQRRPLEGN